MQRLSIKRRLSRWLWKIERKRNISQHRLIPRLRHALDDYRRWHDWGGPVMALFGRADCGNYGPPEPGAWYWYEDGHKPRRWGRTWRSRIVIAKTYDAKRKIDADVEAAQEAWRERHPIIGQKYHESIDTWLDERGDIGDDRFPEPPYWHYFNVQDDGSTLIPGSVYSGQGGVNYGLSRVPARMLVRYIVVEWWLKANWFGLRPWIYYRALHAKVNGKVPFTCQVVPPQGSGGYSHWHCGLKKRHAGAHRYNNYVWDPATKAVEYAPVNLARRGSQPARDPS